MEIVVRATIVFWFLWLVVRVTGKRSLSELTPLDLLLVVVVGDPVQQGVTQEDMSMTGAVLAASVFVGWTLLADALEKRSVRARRLLSGEPMIVLHEGKPLEERLERERITLEELKEAARLEGHSDLRELEYAVLETNGKFSFISERDRS
jgi:uncharacterized membrane protein YcaP (DUF421 family)